MIISFILMTLMFVLEVILMGENSYWSLLEVKGFTQGPLHWPFEYHVHCVSHAESDSDEL